MVLLRHLYSRRSQALSVLGALLIIAGGAACSKGEDTPKAAPVTQANVTFGERLDEIRGHHLVALELYRKGDEKGAAIHAGHPVAEISAAVNPTIKKSSPDVAADLDKRLAATTDAIAKSLDVDTLRDRIRATDGAVTAAERAVLGDTRNTNRFRCSVVAAVFKTAAAEYSEAVKDGAITEAVEYQDAYGFTTVASKKYATLKDAMTKADAHGAKEIDEALAKIHDGLPGVTLPKRALATTDEFTRWTKTIGHELNEGLDALLDERVEPAEQIPAIDDLLDHAVTELREGNRNEAAELVARAYLDHFEGIEGALRAKSPKLLEAIEPILGTQLRAEIKSGGSVTKVSAMVTAVKKLLNQAQLVLAPSMDH